jgi:hypothetical protein
MFSIQMRSFLKTNEEGGAIGVGARICHRENSRARVIQSKVLIWKFATVDGFSATGSTFESLGWGWGGEERRDSEVWKDVAITPPVTEKMVKRDNERESRMHLGT